MHSIPGLPQAAVEALQRGDKLAAIRLVRKATGADLKAAADAVERYARDPRHAQRLEPVSGAAHSQPADAATRIFESLMRGDRIDAIKLLREAAGADLGNTKTTIERLLQPHRHDSQAGGSHVQTDDENRLSAKLEAGRAQVQALMNKTRPPTVMPGDAPNAGWAWMLIAIAAALVLLFGWFD
jgi:ribosomal protein L7/L12